MQKHGLTWNGDTSLLVHGMEYPYSHHPPAVSMHWGAGAAEQFAMLTGFSSNRITLFQGVEPSSCSYCDMGLAFQGKSPTHSIGQRSCCCSSKQPDEPSQRISSHSEMSHLRSRLVPVLPISLLYSKSSQPDC